MTEQKITLSDIASGLSRRASLPMRYSEDFVRSFFKVIEEGLMHDNLVKIKGFGTFKLVGVDARESINVNTGERFEIAGHTKVSFTPDAAMRDTVNKPFLEFETVILNDSVDTTLMETIDGELLQTEPADEPQEVVVEPTVESDIVEESSLEPTSNMENEESMEVVPAQAVEVAPETGTEINAEAEVESSSESVPDPVSGSVSEQTPEAVPEAVLDSAPADEKTSNTASETTIGTDEGEVADAIPETIVAGRPSQTECVDIDANAEKSCCCHHGWGRSILCVLMAVFFTALGYALAEYWHPVSLPKLECPIQITEKASESQNSEQTPKEQPKQKAGTQQPKQKTESQQQPQNVPVVKQPSETLAYPQVEGGEYWIVGVEGTEIMRPGNTLLKYSMKYYKSNDFVEYICTMNDIKNPDIVPLDKELRIPKLQKKQ